MPVGIKSSGGGTTTLVAANSATNYTATLPANSGTVVTTGSTAVVTQAMMGAASVGATQLAATAALSNLYGLTYLPLFSGYRDSGNVSASSVVLHNNINVNTGSCYSSATGRFTCPVAGNYEVSIGGHAENAQPVELTILKNGSSVQGEYSNGSAYGAVTCTTVLSCAANDYIQQRVTTGTFWGGNNSGLRMTVKLISI